MSRPHHCLSRALLAGLLLASVATSSAFAQGTLDDYRRALTLETRYAGLVTNVADNFNWIDNDRVAFRRSVQGGHRFYTMNVTTATESPAFDHARLATTMSTLLDTTVTEIGLPFTNVAFDDNGATLEARAQGRTFRCTLSDYNCTATVRDGPPTFNRNANADAPTRPSPDGRLEALIHNYNIVIRNVGGTEPLYKTHDGSENNAYSLQSIAWAPDSRRVAVYRIIPGHDRLVHYVESSPADQVQPKHFTRNYTKPGDVLVCGSPYSSISMHVHTPQSATRCSRTHTRCRRCAGAMTAANSRSSTTSAGTRSIA